MAGVGGADRVGGRGARLFFFCKSFRDAPCEICTAIFSCPLISMFCNGGVTTGGGGALRFFTSGFAVIPEMLPRDSDEPRLLEREFTEGEFGAVEKTLAVASVSFEKSQKPFLFFFYCITA